MSPKRSGKGLVNSLINHLPIELHAPGYQYCGPGTNLKKRIKRGDPGINGLDQACKEHDIAYAETNDLNERNQADKVLAKKAWERFKSKDASFGERATALSVAGVMKAKSKMGMGIRRKKTQNIKKKKSKTRKRINKKSTKTRKTRKNKKTKTKKRKTSKKTPIRQILKKAMTKAKTAVKNKRPQTVPAAAKLALNAARVAIKNHKISKKNIHDELPRIIPVPKIGGVLPLVPIFAGLSALGALMGGSASVANAVVSANNAKKNFKEAQRHNESMEAIVIGKNTKTGKGLYMMPYKKGLGLYLTPLPKNV